MIHFPSFYFIGKFTNIFIKRQLREGFETLGDVWY